MSSGVFGYLWQLETAEAVSNCLVYFLQQDGDPVRALPRKRCYAALTGKAGCCIRHAVESVIIPQIKQDSSRATAVFATFAFFPFPSTI